MTNQTLTSQLNTETENHLKPVLQSLQWATDDEGNINKLTLSKLLNSHNPTTEDVTQAEALMKALLENEALKQQFFYNIGNTPVFNKEAFLTVLHANHIGLNVWGQCLKEIRDVVLDFPYKDCVLEGGQTKDDDKGSEVFYNEVLAPSAISRLKLPKAFNKVERWETHPTTKKATLFTPRYI